MINKKVIAVFSLVLQLSCGETNTSNNIEKWKNEIFEIEKSFNVMAQEDGISETFEHFAAPNATINRNNKLIKGPEAIGEFYKTSLPKNTSL
ncbi:MAG: hypothetical protein R3213_11250, partial [Flavobacteriaceae bacterium]|nr:hypothetical protein [Flavobacteriaceae bacterium]